MRKNVPRIDSLNAIESVEYNLKINASNSLFFFPFLPLQSLIDQSDDDKK